MPRGAAAPLHLGEIPSNSYTSVSPTDPLPSKLLAEQRIKKKNQTKTPSNNQNPALPSHKVRLFLGDTHLWIPGTRRTNAQHSTPGQNTLKSPPSQPASLDLMLFLLLPSPGTQKQLRGGVGELAGSHPKHTLSQSKPAASDFGESCAGDVDVNPKIPSVWARREGREGA